jgi:hypothetical protein
LSGSETAAAAAFGHGDGDGDGDDKNEVPLDQWPIELDDSRLVLSEAVSLATIVVVVVDVVLIAGWIGLGWISFK